MLFNSYEFIFLFLPISVALFYGLNRLGNKRWPIVWLVAASLFFYAWWNPPYLILLLLSIAINYGLSVALNRAFVAEQERKGKLILWVGVLFNLGLIGYYKYFDFFLGNVNQAVGTSLPLQNIILPLGISFYTFQQIAYLVDSFEGETQGERFLDYCLFVSFFPQLIAGPIVNHQEMLPQFSKRSTFLFKHEDLSVGLTIFFIGLFKKVIFADQISLYASPIFSAAEQGIPLTFSEAWIGALAYSLQIYFDFSGYSDMAIGAARMFGIKLPLNFNSPYKAFNIIDFWARWHMTLTRFLTRYLYNPIALFMSRRRLQQGKALIKRGVGSPAAFAELVAVPTLVTMLLAGIWHGAGWQYIIFGLLNGSYLTLNHGWHMLQKKFGRNLKQVSWYEQRLGQLVTLVAWIASLVFFRAVNAGAGISMLSSMFGFRGISVPPSLEGKLSVLKAFGFRFDGMFHNALLEQAAVGLGLILLLFIVALFFPNTQQWMAHYEPGLGYDHRAALAQRPKWLIWLDRFEWHPTHSWALFTVSLMVISVLNLSNVSEFIYFQF